MRHLKNGWRVKNRENLRGPRQTYPRACKEETGPETDTGRVLSVSIGLQSEGLLKKEKDKGGQRWKKSLKKLLK